MTNGYDSLDNKIDRLRAENKELKRQIDRLRTMSTVEMMCENQNVKNHITEWEERCLKAEQQLKDIRKLLVKRDMRTVPKIYKQILEPAIAISDADLDRLLEEMGKCGSCSAVELVLANIAEAKTLKEAKSMAQGWFGEPEPEGGKA